MTTPWTIPLHGKLIERLGLVWPAAPLTTERCDLYRHELGDLDFDAVMAAVRSFERDGREFMPTAGMIRRRVFEHALDAPEWHEVKRAILDWKAERERVVSFEWSCPHGACDGSGYVVAEQPEGRADIATPCRCLDARRTARRRDSALHPLIVEFRDNYVSYREMDRLMAGDSTVEAQTRNKWEQFVHDRVESHALAGIEAPQVRRIERANRVAPRPAGIAISAAVAELEGGEPR